MADKYKVTVNGVPYDVEVELLGEGASPLPVPDPVSVSSPASPVQAPSVSKAAAPSKEPSIAPAPSPVPSGGETVTSPMPGKILRILTSQGASVKPGDVLMILEAMKMENEIVSPCSGTVTQIAAKEGATVNSGDVLAVIG